MFGSPSCSINFSIQKFSIYSYIKATTICDFRYFGRQFFTGGIAEICVWNGVNSDTVGGEIDALKAKYGVEIGGALCSELPSPPEGSLARFCAGGDGVGLSGDILTHWDDENGVFSSEGFGGGGALTVTAAGFPAGPRRVVNFPGSAGIKLDNDQAAELTKGKVAEGGAATDDAVKKAVVGPAQ